MIPDDVTLRAILEQAVVPPLLPAVAQLTGDLSLLRPHLRPDPALMRSPQAGLTDDQQHEARDVAFEALRSFRDSGATAAESPDDAVVSALMDHVMGEPVPDRYVPMVREELAVGGEDRRAPAWRLDELAPVRRIEAIVVGAGMSGLLAAHRLRQAGVPCTVLEKNADLGGTWHDNTYPGCRVDVYSHLYSYSFAQLDDWPHHFSEQPALFRYFAETCDRLGLRDLIRFGTSVTACRWSDETSTWTVEATGPGGSYTLDASVLVMAVGQLNRPLLPDIAGREHFAGPAFHSARWDHTVDLDGKRVGVIGTGASAAQLVPEVAEAAGSVTIFQRSPAWLMPTPDYQDEVPDGLRVLFAAIPGYSQWYRFWLFWRGAEGLLPFVTADPDWIGGPGAVGAKNDEFRSILTDYFTASLGDRPDLLAKTLPTYPPGAKRVLRDNGAWARTLLRPDVHLVTDPIAEIIPEGVVCADGTVHEVDVIVHCTGFSASDFLTPMTVVGRDGVDLHEHWDGDATAYLGISVPGFPNMFLCYGPNTNIVVNGSIIFFSECEVRYVVDAVRLLAESGAGSMEVDQVVHDRYNDEVDNGNRMMAWGCADASSWYRNRTGRVSQNWPFSLHEFWRRTLAVDRADYHLR